MAARTLLVTAALICAVFARRPKWHELSEKYSFERYLVDFHKVYSAEEKVYREANFKKNLQVILAHNKQGRSYKMGVNHLVDFDDSELVSMRGGRFEAAYEGKYSRPYVRKDGAVANESVDYRTVVPSVLTAVKDQGSCGDCWAHAVTEAIESSYAIATGELFVLSQQQVTSCTPLTGSCYSCNGSFPTLGYDYVVENGITEEWIYPFEAYNGSFPACKSNPYLPTPVQTIVNISGYTNVGSNSQPAVEEALSNLGPLSILVDASDWSFYETGIFDGCDYSVNISLDHAVNLVGYGTQDGSDYWIVRNSWAPSWGESGFIRLAKNAVPECGWNVGAAHSAGCFGVGPNQVWSCGQCGVLFAPQFPVVNI
ncbi:cysteine peptidase, putative [Bodo saltans]|uniref:Cysteine peptidase, putative n=1 Tax=Bodo saltans TaxID=75058 RepID=A0A0S4J3Q7_BODSA|nr:cysteine peptidase, putative [Bodo saltans]|eukprot:CUG86070.1 cysteine peptidase, putative [Bodo saltans]